MLLDLLMLQIYNHHKLCFEEFLQVLPSNCLKMNTIVVQDLMTNASYIINTITLSYDVI